MDSRIDEINADQELSSDDESFSIYRRNRRKTKSNNIESIGFRNFMRVQTHRIRKSTFVNLNKILPNDTLKESNRHPK
jgi:hypothetical protein